MRLCQPIEPGRTFVESIDEVDLPVSIVALGKVLPEVAAAALLAAQRRARDQARDGHQIAMAPRRRRRASTARTARRRRPRRARDRFARALRACGTARRDRHIRSRIGVSGRRHGARGSVAGRLRLGCSSAASSVQPREPRIAIGFSAAARGGCCIATAARAPNTSPSSSELLASRFAPWTPVQATSPAANRPGSEVRPHSSVSTPPMM